MRQLTITVQITNRQHESLDKYFQEIGKLDMITAEEEVALAKRIRQGDKVALEKLTKANLRFVVSVAKQYHYTGTKMTLGDLISEGNLGLIRAAERFDDTRGFKFISYAVWWIRQAIVEAISKHSKVIRLPLNQISDQNKTYRTYARLEQRYQREPSDEELATEMDISLDRLAKNKLIAFTQMSLDAPLEYDGANSLLEVLSDQQEPAPDQVLFQDSLSKQVNSHLSGLLQREASVLTLFFGLNGCQAMGLNSIADSMGLSGERVRQIKDQALVKLRNNPKNDLLKAYL